MKRHITYIAMLLTALTGASWKLLPATGARA